MTSKEIAARIIDRVRNHPDWKPNHASINVGDRNLRYYDTDDKGYYGIKGFDGPVEVSVFPDGHGKIEFVCGNIGEFERFFSTFLLVSWLLNIDQAMITAGILTKAEQEAKLASTTVTLNEITVNDVIYVRKETV